MHIIIFIILFYYATLYPLLYLKYHSKCCTQVRIVFYDLLIDGMVEWYSLIKHEYSASN